MKEQDLPRGQIIKTIIMILFYIFLAITFIIYWMFLDKLLSKPKNKNKPNILSLLCPRCGKDLFKSYECNNCFWSSQIDAMNNILKDKQTMKKQFKLIKEYPGSPEIGSEVELENLPMNMYLITNSKDKNKKTYISTSFVENQSEFWQEIKPKEWEITSFKAKCNTLEHTLRKNGIYIFKSAPDENEYYKNYDKLYNEKALLNNNAFYIYSVKRLSDGDETIPPQLVKQPLFKTEDGVDIYVHDKYYNVKFSASGGMWEQFKVYGSFNAVNEDGKKKQEHIKAFSTREAAEEYITMNKPCLSLKEVEDIANTVKSRGKLSIALTQLIKEKLKL